MEERLRWCPVVVHGAQLDKFKAVEGGHAAEGLEDSRKRGVRVLHTAAVEHECALGIYGASVLQ